jgi:hypothetical protein
VDSRFSALYSICGALRNLALLSTRPAENLVAVVVRKCVLQSSVFITPKKVMLKRKGSIVPNNWDLERGRAANDPTTARFGTRR